MRGHNDIFPWHLDIVQDHESLHWTGLTLFYEQLCAVHISGPGVVDCHMSNILEPWILA